MMNKVIKALLPEAKALFPAPACIDVSILYHLR